LIWTALPAALLLPYHPHPASRPNLQGTVSLDAQFLLRHAETKQAAGRAQFPAARLHQRRLECKQRAQRSSSDDNLTITTELLSHSGPFTKTAERHRSRSAPGNEPDPIFRNKPPHSHSTQSLPSDLVISPTIPSLDTYSALSLTTTKYPTTKNTPLCCQLEPRALFSFTFFLEPLLLPRT